ncbi:MAG: hypothetical protein AAGG50_15315 [Bacteroidota bacterium]
MISEQFGLGGGFASILDAEGRNEPGTSMAFGPTFYSRRPTAADPTAGALSLRVGFVPDATFSSSRDQIDVLSVAVGVLAARNLIPSEAPIEVAPVLTGNAALLLAREASANENRPLQTNTAYGGALGIAIGARLGTAVVVVFQPSFGATWVETQRADQIGFTLQLEFSQAKAARL